jgi:phospholipid:diacylglycerol acyltransferase
MLDPITGLDPPGAKIRAAEGIGAASSFMTGYWIWYVSVTRRSFGYWN